MHLRVGTRKSRLALIQTELVVAQLRSHVPNLTIDLVPMSTRGDQVLDVALSRIGEKGLFTKELEDALLEDKVDVVVHSLKDMSSTLPSGLCIGAVLERASPYDAIVLSKRHDPSIKSLSDLPAGAVIGTSSVRRVAQLRAKFPHLVSCDVRGNLATRLQKLDSPAEHAPQYDALMLAKAGLDRCGDGFASRINFLVDDTVGFYYAVGQGAVAVECRCNDNDVLQLLQLLTHVPTKLCTEAERAFLHRLEGGCSVPLGVRSSLDDVVMELCLEGCVYSLDGQAMIHSMKKVYLTGINDVQAARQLGIDLGNSLIDMGARTLLNMTQPEKATQGAANSHI